MPTGEELLLARHYDRAIAKLKKESHEDQCDDFLVGPSLLLGIGYICTLQTDLAIDHINQLIGRTRYSMGDHQVYLGIAQWTKADYKGAVHTWNNGLNSNYTMYDGLEFCFLLLYSASRVPQLFSKSKSKDLIRKHLKRTDPDDFPAQIAHFVLGDLNEQVFLNAATQTTGKNAELRSKQQANVAQFYVGLRALVEGDSGQFEASMAKCANDKEWQEISFEWVISNYERSRPILEIDGVAVQGPFRAKK